MILDTCDDVFVFKEQLGIVAPVVEGIDEMKFRLCEMKQAGKKLDDCGLGSFKVKAVFLPKYRNEGCTYVAVLYGLNGLKII